MAIIDVKSREEMKKIKNALHIDVRDGKLYVWGDVNQEVCIYPHEFALMDPDGPPSNGTLTLPPSGTVTVPMPPPSPPAEVRGTTLCETIDGHCEVTGTLTQNPEPPKTPPVDVGMLEYKGNSVSYIYDKMRAYGKCIDDCWGVMMRHGITSDGETHIEDILDKCLPKAPPEADQPPLEYKLNCAKYPKEIGKKPANSCTGCTLPGCKAKGAFK